MVLLRPQWFPKKQHSLKHNEVWKFVLTLLSNSSSTTPKQTLTCLFPELQFERKQNEKNRTICVYDSGSGLSGCWVQLDSTGIYSFCVGQSVHSWHWSCNLVNTPRKHSECHFVKGSVSRTFWFGLPPCENQGSVLLLKSTKTTQRKQNATFFSVQTQQRTNNGLWLFSNRRLNSVYVQSPQVSRCWHNVNQCYFDGRLQSWTQREDWVRLHCDWVQPGTSVK